MTKIMATLFAAFVLVVLTSPEARAMPRQDAKSVAIDATTHAPSNYAFQIRDAQRRRVEIQKRADQKIIDKRVQLRRAAKARAEARAQAQSNAATQAAQSYTASPSLSVPAALACIRAHESGGNYQAVNSLGYAGAYQLSPYYKDDWARRYGYSQYANVPVVQWPPSVQDAVALGLFNDTNGGAWFKFAPYSC